MRGVGSKTFSMSGQPSNTSDVLPLTNQEYYTLLELLVFHVNLPMYGMSETVRLLKETPMNAKIKSQFVARLGKVRNFVVADVTLTNGKQLEYVD